MVKTKRYQGLLFLKEQGLPVPNFIKIDSIDQISNNYLNTYAPFGWTIRTCKKDGVNEISLFYKNNISKEELKNILRDRLVKFLDEFYIVYYSWDFNFSFNILKTKYNYIIEGKFGSQKDISSGSENPVFAIEFDRLTKSYKEAINQTLNQNIKGQISLAIKYLNNIDSLENLYSEVAITKKDEMFFYELWNIKEL